MEALYNNIPVIASNVGGIPEILKSDFALFDPISAELKRKLADLAINKDSLNELKKLQAVRKQELTFDWTQKIFESIIGDNNS